MKLEIYKEGERPEVKLKLRLLPCESAVSLCVVDDDGHLVKYLVSIKPDGMIYRHMSCDGVDGLQLDPRGRVVITDNPPLVS